jgi:hypothetical protein
VNDMTIVLESQTPRPKWVSTRTIKRVQAVSGIVFSVFLVMHFANTWASLLGPGTVSSWNKLFRYVFVAQCTTFARKSMPMWRFAPIEILLAQMWQRSCLPKVFIYCIYHGGPLLRSQDISYLLLVTELSTATLSRSFCYSHLLECT